MKHTWALTIMYPLTEAEAVDAHDAKRAAMPPTGREAINARVGCSTCMQRREWIVDRECPGEVPKALKSPRYGRTPNRQARRLIAREERKRGAQSKQK